MAVSYIRPAGGLSAADKQIVRDNMLETASIQHGKLQGTLPVQVGYSYQLPMFESGGITIPAGYYAEPISVTQKYLSGTVLTDFSATGFFGAYTAHKSGDSDYFFSAAEGNIYLKSTTYGGQTDGHYIESASLSFNNKVGAGFSYAIVTLSTTEGHCGVCFFSGKNGNPKAIPLNANSSGTLYVQISIPSGGGYLHVRAGGDGIVQPWNIYNKQINISKITFYA